MVPLNMTYLHCLQHSLFEHLFNLYSATLRYLQQHAKCCVRQYNDKLESRIFTSLYSTISARQQLGLEKISVIEKTTLVYPDRQLISVSSYVK